MKSKDIKYYNYAGREENSSGEVFWRIGWTSQLDLRMSKHKKDTERQNGSFIQTHIRCDDNKRNLEKAAHVYLTSELASIQHLHLKKEKELFLDTEKTRNYIEKEFTSLSDWNEEFHKIHPTCCENKFNQTICTKRKWQEKSVSALSVVKHSNINANVAAGKTLTSKWIIHEKLKHDKELKVIIVAPRKNILHNFEKEEYMQDADGNIFHWKIIHRGTINDNDVNNFLSDFLECKNTHIHNRIATITHQSLLKVDLSTFSNVLLVLDEAHHAETTDKNQIGNVLNYILENTEKQNLQTILMTATPWRTDGKDIIPEKYSNLYENSTFNYSIYEYFQDSKYIEDFQYSFRMSETTYQEQLNLELENYQKNDKVIIFVPISVSSDSLKTSRKDVLACYRAISGVENPQIKLRKDGVTEVMRGNEIIQVIDLVDKDKKLRKQRLSYINDNKNDASKIDIILNMKIFEEGSDYPLANRIIMIGKNNSVLNIIQRIGRALRDTSNKFNNPPRITHIIPFASTGDEEIEEDDFDTFINGLSLTMLLHDIREERKENGSIVENLLARNKGNFKTISEENILFIKYFIYFCKKDSSLGLKTNKDILIDKVLEAVLKEYPDKYLSEEELRERIALNYKLLRNETMRQIRSSNYGMKLKQTGIEPNIDYQNEKEINLLDGINPIIKISGMRAGINELYERARNEIECNEEDLKEKIDECIRYYENEGNGKYPPQEYRFNNVNLGTWITSRRIDLNIKTKEFCKKYATSLGHPNLFEKQIIMGNENNIRIIDAISQFYIKENRLPITQSKNAIEKKIANDYSYLLEKYKTNIKGGVSKEIINYGNNCGISFFWEGARFVNAYLQLISIVKIKFNTGKYPLRSAANNKGNELAKIRSNKNKAIWQRIFNHPDIIEELKSLNSEDIIDNHSAKKQGWEQAILDYVKTTNKFPSYEIKHREFNIGTHISVMRHARLLKVRTKFSHEVDKLLNKSGLEGILRPQNNAIITNKLTGRKESIWQPGLGRGFSFDINWIPCTPADIWYNEVQSMSEQEIEDRKIDIEYAEKELELFMKEKKKR